MIDMKSKKEMPKKCESDNTFALLLTRLKRFHALMLIVCTSGFFYLFYSAIKQAVGTPEVAGPASPNAYSLSTTVPAILTPWFVCTWWVWIPRDSEDFSKTASKTSSVPLSDQKTGEKGVRSISKTFKTPTVSEKGGGEDLTGAPGSEIPREPHSPTPEPTSPHERHEEDRLLVSGEPRPGGVQGGGGGSAEVSLERSVSPLPDESLESPSKISNLRIFNPYVSPDLVSEGNEDLEE